MAGKKKFWKEVKRQTRLAIAAAIGFIIAFAWKDYILRLAGSVFEDISLTLPTTSKFLTALILTLIGVGLIFISSRLLE